MQDFVARNQQIAIGNTKRFIPTTRLEIWLQNRAIRTLPYLPGKKIVLDMATKGVREGSQRHRAGTDPRLTSRPAAEQP